MAKYECPQCNGGFPEPGPENECPWCGTKLDGESHSPLTVPTNTTNGPDFGESELPDFTSDLDSPQIGPLDPSTTPCPECGEDMPMVTWTGSKPKCHRCQRMDNSPFLTTGGSE